MDLELKLESASPLDFHITARYAAPLSWPLSFSLTTDKKEDLFFRARARVPPRDEILIPRDKPENLFPINP
jgi:hypothetical protein